MTYTATYVNVAPSSAPGGNPGNEWGADLAALDVVHADPWANRRPEYTLFGQLP